MFSGFGLKPPTSGFQSIFTVASRLLHLYSTDDKTDEKFLHTEGHLERYRVTWRREEGGGS